MDNILFTWIGDWDLKTSAGEGRKGLGPAARTVLEGNFEEAVILSDYAQMRGEAYGRWLQERTKTKIFMRHVHLPGGITHYASVHKVAVEAIEETIARHKHRLDFTYQTSPGTNTMGTVWILLAKTKYPGLLLECSSKEGVKPLDVPFEIAAEFLPALISGTDSQLARFLAGGLPDTPEFGGILFRSSEMRVALERAARMGPRSVPVVIEGESGTGKELVARAIHSASHHGGKAPFVALNCGAIPKELVESELFGHVKGAFTGAIDKRRGKFEEADGGTLFLDEIGELDLPQQVKLLRVLQEGEFSKVGDDAVVKVKVRVIAATNRNLVEEIRAGRFRQDLYYRLSVGTILLPPLRQRHGDIGHLVDHFMGELNKKRPSGERAKRLTPGARAIILAHSWPGNVRELRNTLERVFLWSSGETLEPIDIKEALLPDPTAGCDGIMDRKPEEGFNLQEVIGEVARHYLELAMKETSGNKAKAARILGLGSAQTLMNWMEKYGVSP